MDDTAERNNSAIPGNTSNLSSLVIAKYRIYAEAIDNIEIKGFKGSVFHGGFGYALKLISPSIFQYFFQPPFKGDPPRPYIIVPPLDQNENYKVGDKFTFDLILIGPAVQHFPICFAAFEKLGTELGIGSQRSKFKLTQIDFFNNNNQSQRLYKNNNWQFIDSTINAYQLSQTDPVALSQLTLKFPSFLRIKNNAKLVNEAPDFRLLMDRLLGRICTISKFYNKENELLLCRSERDALLEQAEGVSTMFNNLKWRDWTRYSSRQQTEMKFGGLTGTIQYRGELEPFIPYLKIGQWLHVGGKTSFGLGGYEMEIG